MELLSTRVNGLGELRIAHRVVDDFLLQRRRRNESLVLRLVRHLYQHLTLVQHHLL